RLAKISSTVFPGMSTTACSLVSFRNGAGMRTLAGMWFLRKLVVNLAKLRDRRGDHDRLFHLIKNDFLRLIAVAGDKSDRDFVGPYFTRSRHLLQSGHGHPAGRFGVDAFRLGQREDAFDHLLVGHAFRAAAGLLGDLERVVAVRGVANRKTFSDGVGLDRLDDVGTFSPSGHNRRAAFRLGAGHSGLVLRDQTNLYKFLKSLVDLGE